MKIIYLLMILVTVGCSNKVHPQQDNIPITSTDYRLIDGRYHVTNKNQSALQILLGIDFRNKRIASDDSTQCTLRIRAVDERTVKVALVTPEGKTIERVFKGKIKDDAFIFTTRYWIKGIPPLFWIVGNLKSTFGVDTNQHLTLYEYRGGMALIGILPVFGTSNGGEWHTYEVLK